MGGGRHCTQAVDQTQEPELADDIGQALPGRRQADSQQPSDPVPGGPQVLTGQPQPGSAPDQQCQDDASADRLAACRADRDTGQAQTGNPPPAQRQQPGQIDIHYIHQDHHLHPRPGVPGASQSGVTHGRARQERRDGSHDPQESGRRKGGQPGKVHRGHDPRGEELHQQQRENPQTQTHRKRLAAEPGGLDGSSRTHRPSHQRRAANRADGEKRSQEPEQVAGDRHPREMLGSKIAAGQDRVRKADQVEQ